MGEYLTDILLILSLIGAPIILGTLLYYGMTISERRHHGSGDKPQTDKTPEKAPAQREPGDKDKPVERSAGRPLDLAKQRTGMSG